MSHALVLGIPLSMVAGVTNATLLTMEPPGTTIGALPLTDCREAKPELAASLSQQMCLYHSRTVSIGVSKALEKLGTPVGIFDASPHQGKS